MTPQAKTVLKHLQSNDHLTALQAIGVYGIYRLAARILEIRAHIDATGAHLTVHTENVADAKGKRYARYSLRPLAAPLDIPVTPIHRVKTSYAEERAAARA